ncbi:hypothetical protein [Runella limosa]|uniref:hypothetical protein n=1 Tax=Runella limosa TaxID=370978 RepID=UPI0003F768BC|nr:hypothetical protein [Runella limosa]
MNETESPQKNTMLEPKISDVYRRAESEEIWVVTMLWFGLNRALTQIDLLVIKPGPQLSTEQATAKELKDWLAKGYIYRPTIRTGRVLTKKERETN